MFTLNATPPIGIVLGLVTLQILYLLVTTRLRDQVPGSQPVANRQMWLFSEGIFVLFLALASPLQDLSDNYLFTAHMVQHLLLVLVALPLLLAGTPGWLLRGVLERTRLLPVARALRHPVAALGIFNVIFLFAHAPRLYEPALGNELLHALEHGLFLLSGLLFWIPILSPAPDVLPRYSGLGQLVYIFAQTVPSSLLGAFLGLAATPLYPTYQMAPRIIPELSALQDQQLGGLLMWVGGSTYYLVALGIVFYFWARDESAADRRDAVRARPHVP
ncbi:MAG: cytochrome c oxidase assembly protein [Chloroflexi bacterium]|nr:cytochrome c oxidase assembly protein [Chloroflexota bacterium]